MPMINKRIVSKKYICPGCGFKSDSIYDFSPSIKIDKNNFRFFHFYSGMIGPKYCNQCKRKFLLSIYKQKHLTKKQVLYLQKKIKEKEKKYEKQ